MVRKRIVFKPRVPPPRRKGPRIIMSDDGEDDKLGDSFFVEEGPVVLKVELTSSKRWKNFRADRRLYRVTFDTNKSRLQGSEHLLLNLCLSQILTKIIIKIIEDIKRRHLKARRDENALVSFFFNADGLSSPLLSSTGPLFENVVRDKFLELLEELIFSSQFLDIRNGFVFDTTVVDDAAKPSLFWVAGAKWRLKIPKQWEESKWCSKQGLFFMPSMEEDPLYQDCCLLAAIACSILFNKEMEAKLEGKKSERWVKLRYLNARYNQNGLARRKVAFQTLRDFMDYLVLNYNLSLDKFRRCELNDDLRREVDKLNILLVVIKDSTNLSPVFTHPRRYDGKRQPVYILATSLFDTEIYKRDGTVIYHAVSILKPSSFADRILRTKSYCILCNKMFGEKSIFVHNCRPDFQRCSLCRHIIQKPDMYTNFEIQKSRCDPQNCSPTNKEKLMQCQKCGKSFQNGSCLTRHKRFCRLNQLLCTTCGHLYPSNKSHTCGARFCKTCSVSVEGHERHVCQMRKVKPHKTISLMAFFDLETITFGKDNKHHANAVGFSWESSEKQGVFNEVYFYDDDMNHPKDGVVLRESFHCQYWTTSQTEKFKRPKISKRAKGKLFKYVSRFNRQQLSDSVTINYDGDECEEVEEDEEEEADEVQESMQYEPTLDKSAITKFIAFILSEDFYGTTLIAHNSSRFDSILFLEEAMKRKLEVKPLFDGCKLLLLEIPLLNIRIIDSYRYVKIPLAKFPDRFPEIKQWLSHQTKGVFPYKFNRPENYEYRGCLPEISYFVDTHTSESNVKKCRDFANDWPADKIWNFKEEIHYYLVQDVHLLRAGCLSMVKELLSFQEQIHLDRKSAEMDFFFAFNQPFFTLSSFVHRMWIYFELEPNSLYLLENEKNGRNTSKFELEWISYLQHQGCEISRSAIASEGQIKLGPYFPDGYDPNTNTVYEFLGCLVHFHRYENEACPKCVKLNNDSPNPFGLKCEFAHLNWIKKKTFFEKEGYKVVVMWECDYIEMRQENESLKDFLNYVYYAGKRPESRLRIRSALRGGRTEAFRLLYNKNNNPDTIMSYIDRNSLYPSVAIFKTFPVGIPKTLVGEAADSIYVQNNGFYYKEKPIFGILQVSILPPDSLFLPVLPFTSGGKLKFGLCRTCVDQMSQDFCHHEDKEREICDVYTSVEILFALKWGYKIRKIWEFKAYFEMRPIFKSFYTRLAKIKLENEGFPSHVKTQLEKLNYVDDLNNHMEGLNLRMEKIVLNLALRYFAKQISNIALGKMSQDDDRANVVYVQNMNQYLEMRHCDAKIEVVNLQPLNDEIAEVRYRPVKEMMGFHENANAVVYSFVTAYARIGMLEDMYKLQNVGAKIYYTDTDSIIFTTSTGFDRRLLEKEFCMNSTKYNAYKEETDCPIVSFASLGSKNYSFVTEKGESTVKTRGFTLQSASAKKVLNHDSMKDMLVKFLQGEQAELQSKNFHMKIDRRSHSIYSEERTKIYKNNSFDKRMLTKNILGKHSSDIVTLPFGLKHLDFADCGENKQF